VTIERRVSARRRAVPQAPKRNLARIVAIVVVVLFAIAALAFVLFRDEIERHALETQLGSALHADVAIAHLHHDGGATVLDGVHTSFPRGGFTFDVQTVRYTTAGDGSDIAVSRPVALVSVAQFDADAERAPERVADALHLGAVTVHITDGSLTIRPRDPDVATTEVPVAAPTATDLPASDLPAAGSAPAGAASPAAEPASPPPEPIVPTASELPQHLAVGAIRGTIRAGRGAPKYTLLGDLLASDGRYPITARAPAAGGTGWTWEAARLPLAALLFGDRLWARGGILRDVAISGGAAIRGTASLENGTVVLDGRLIDGLTGPLVAGPDAIGSQGLAGAFPDGTPVQFVGEIDDAVRPLAALFVGTPDLVRWADLFTITARQPQLRSLRTEIMAPGVGFAQYAVASAVGPHVIQVVTVDPREKTVRFDTAISGDHVVSRGGERTSDLGLRTGALAGVNGDYFDIARTYEPQGLLIRNGVLVRGPADRHALVIDRHGKVTFAEFRLTGEARTATQRYPITQLNTWPAGGTTVITPDYNTDLPPAVGVTFAALAPTGVEGRYRVASIVPATATIPVVFGLAFGPKVTAPLPRVGETIAVRYGLDPAVPDAVTGIGGGPRLLRDGVWYEDPHAPAPDERDVRWPVVALAARRDESLMFAAVDGRHPERSVGMTRPEFAELLRSLGAVDAMALDSGGSVTMVGRVPGDAVVTVRNQPSDDSAERYISDALFVYSAAPIPKLLAKPSPTPTPAAVPASNP
jgi:hypothetical protein